MSLADRPQELRNETMPAPQLTPRLATALAKLLANAEDQQSAPIRESRHTDVIAS